MGSVPAGTPAPPATPRRGPTGTTAVAVGTVARRWEELEHRGRALIPEAACRIDEWGYLGVEWLASASEWLADAAAGGWAELIGPLPQQRSYRRIVASPNLEAWVILWPEGGRLQLHDHGGASGALSVVTGTLDEHFLAGGRGPGGYRTIAAGQGVSFDGVYIHDVYNSHAAPATSVHIYSSASRPMSFYDLAGGRPRRLDRAVDGASIVEQDQAADQESAEA
jgi:Cysteine dioxygenase type I